MNDNPSIPAEPTAQARILAALTRLGEATAAAVAEAAGLGYSTTTPKLRALQEAGQAEPVRADGRTLWRAVPTGTAPITDLGGQPESAVEAEPTTLPSGAITGGAIATAAPDHPDSEATASTLLGNRPSAGHDDAPEPIQTAETPQPSPEPEASEQRVEPEVDDGVAPDDQPGLVDDVPDTPTARPLVDAPEHLDTTGGDASGAVTGIAVADQPAPPATADTGPGGRSRRKPGTYRVAILAVLGAHPDQGFKVGEVCRAIDAHTGTDSGVVKAGPGAVANALYKLVCAGLVIQTVETPATFQLAPHAAAD